MSGCSPSEMWVGTSGGVEEMGRVHTKALRCSWDKHKKQLSILRKKGY